LRVAISLLVVITIGYIGFTWQRYGSTHPCVILKAMMLPHRSDIERKAAMALERKHSQQGEATHFQDPEIRKMIQQDWERINAAPEIAAKKLDLELATFPLSRCIVEALTWHPPEAPTGN